MKENKKQETIAIKTEIKNLKSRIEKIEKLLQTIAQKIEDKNLHAIEEVNLLHFKD